MPSIQIKQFSKAKHLECTLAKTTSREAMALFGIKKIVTR